MPRIAMILNHPTLKVADTEIGLASGQSVECQVTSAVVQAQPQYQTIPSTGCAGATQSPGLTGYQLVISWLQDWTTAAPGGLSYWAWTNDGTAKWIELTPDVAAPTQKLTGQVYVAAGDYGGTFGDGSAALATSTWPFAAKPTIPAPVAAVAAEADAETVDAA